MYDTDFQNEGVGAVHDSPRWNLGAGSGIGLEFTSSGGDVTVKMAATGSCRELVSAQPASAHQRAAVTLTTPTTLGSQNMFGVCLRYLDADNFVYAVWDFANAAVRVVERVGGVEADVVNVAVTPGAGCGIACELIGRRARVWWETSAVIPGDRPPDASGPLTAVDEGGWGMIGISNATTNARVTRFVVRDMPSAVMPPPAFAVRDAGGLGLALSPVTVTAAGVSGSAAHLEWEVAPADPDDFPEAYADVTPATTLSRVLFARPGYAYDLRVREVAADGALGDWSAPARLTVSGSKDAPDGDLLPTTEYPDVPPDYVMPVNQEAGYTAVISETGRERVVGPFIRPRTTVKLVYKNRQGADIQTLIDFFDEIRGKRTAFKWTHPTTGRAFSMRFDSDDYSITYGDRGAAGVIARFELMLTEVVFGTVTTIAPTVTLDGDA